MQIKKGLKIRSIADENVLIMQGQVGADMTKVASFNNTAKWLWDELNGKEFSLDDVTQLLVSHFNVDVAIAEADQPIGVHRLQR
jgi:hypothetical protein